MFAIHEFWCFLTWNSALEVVVVKFTNVGVANGESEIVRDAEMAFLKSEPETFESNE
mgnify:CR=1 FL=1